MAAAVGKTVRHLCLCSWTCVFEVEEEFSTMSTQSWADGGQEKGTLNKEKLGRIRFLKFRCGDKWKGLQER